MWETVRLDMPDPGRGAMAVSLHLGVNKLQAKPLLH